MEITYGCRQCVTGKRKTNLWRVVAILENGEVYEHTSLYYTQQNAEQIANQLTHATEKAPIDLANGWFRAN